MNNDNKPSLSHKDITQPFEEELVTEAESLDLPDSVGPYKIQALLERGGMSLLYLASHKNKNDTVVVKVLSERFLKNREVVNRFLKEAEIISVTDHDHIVKLYDQGEWEKGLYIAMEYVHGVSLRRYLLQTPISLKKAIEIIIDIAYALCHLHAHGVIHRDLKPDNILVEKKGVVKVIDFGISQLLTEKIEKDGTFRQRIIGTPIYMSPEQYNHPEDVTFSSDIYSLGVISYELILGKLSHGSINLTQLPVQLRRILQRCLQEEPSKRYQDAVDLITDLTSYLHSIEFKQQQQLRTEYFDIAKSLIKMQKNLLPEHLLTSDDVEMAMAVDTEASLGGVTFGVIGQDKEARGIYLGESTAQGASGILHAANISGIIHPLFQTILDPVEAVKKLNQALLDLEKAPPFLLSLLFLNEKSTQYKYCSCGYECLWHLHQKNGEVELLKGRTIGLGIDPELGVEFCEGVLEEGDVLFLPTFSFFMQQSKSSNEKMFSDMILQYKKLPIRMQVENILRHFKAHLRQGQIQHPLTLMALKKR